MKQIEMNIETSRDNYLTICVTENEDEDSQDTSHETEDREDTSHETDKDKDTENKDAEDKDSEGTEDTENNHGKILLLVSTLSAPMYNMN